VKLLKILTIIHIRIICIGKVYSTSKPLLRDAICFDHRKRLESGQG